MLLLLLFIIIIIILLLLYYYYYYYYFPFSVLNKMYISISRVFQSSWLEEEKFKGALSDLRQFLTAESPLKMMKNAFYFTSKAFRSQDI